MAYDPVIDLLIVDDDPHVLAVLEDLFTAEDNIRVAALTDSLEAIDLARHKTFDIVITDLMMPKADGLEVTRVVHEVQPNALVIIVTGFASLETTLEAIHMGVYDYITKPFQIDEFRLLVANAAQRIRLERENRDLKDQLEAAGEDLTHLRAAQTQLRSELEEARRDVQWREAMAGGEVGASGLPSPAASAEKIGKYEKMADDYRVRLMRQREQLGLARRAAGAPNEE